MAAEGAFEEEESLERIRERTASGDAACFGLGDQRQKVFPIRQTEASPHADL